MKKRNYLIILLFMFCCIGWFALARIRENQAPVPGWMQFGNTGEEDPIFRFWLPKYYEGINPKFVTLMLQNTVDGFDSQYSSMLDDVKIVFSARDTRADDTQPDIFVSYSGLASSSQIPELALEEIRSRFDNQSDAKLIDSEIAVINSYNTIFLAYDTNFGGVEVRQIQYIIFDGDIKWSVIYLPNNDRYEEEFSIFQQSIHTFKVNY
jgi:hypothetical protein